MLQRRDDRAVFPAARHLGQKADVRRDILGAEPLGKVRAALQLLHAGKAVFRRDKSERERSLRKVPHAGTRPAAPEGRDLHMVGLAERADAIRRLVGQPCAVPAADLAGLKAVLMHLSDFIFKISPAHMYHRAEFHREINSLLTFLQPYYILYAEKRQFTFLMRIWTILI